MNQEINIGLYAIKADSVFKSHVRIFMITEIQHDQLILNKTQVCLFLVDSVHPKLHKQKGHVIVLLYIICKTTNSDKVLRNATYITMWWLTAASLSSRRAALWCPFLCSTKTLSITSSRGGERKSANITGRIVAMGTGDGRWEDRASCQKRRAAPQFCATQTIKNTWGRPSESIRELLTISKLETYSATRQTQLNVLGDADNEPTASFSREDVLLLEGLTLQTF